MVPDGDTMPFDKQHTMHRQVDRQTGRRTDNRQAGRQPAQKVELQDCGKLQLGRGANQSVNQSFNAPIHPLTKNAV